MGILHKTTKKRKGMTVGFVSFENADQLKNAVEELNGKSIGNKHIKVADVLPRSFVKKTKPTIPEDPNDPLLLNGSENGNNGDNSVVVSKGRSVRSVVTPLAHMPYNEQLDHKKKSLEQILKKLTRNARKACPEGVPQPKWILKSREIGGLPCKLEGIIESPLVNGYRNKCEFSVGYSLHGKATVGFLLGNFREGVIAVEEPIDCPNVSRVACKFASIFQEFLQHSGLPIWNRLNNTGFWRQLTVREGKNSGQAFVVESLEANISEVMLMVQVCSVDIDDEVVKHEFQKMSQAFVQGATSSSPSLPLTSLVIQDHKGISNAAPADAPLHSLPIPNSLSDSLQETASSSLDTRIHDYIGNLCFSISPTAFFQVNTLAAEKLYSLAGDWAGLGPDTLLFDVCCGTGTIGLTLAHRVGKVVGIEMNASAVSDAHRNAEINGIKNCRFVCAKAEDVMGSLLKEYLNTPLEEETLHVSESNDTEGPVNEALTDKLDPDSLIQRTDDVESPSSCPQDNGKNLEDPSQKSCISEIKNGMDALAPMYKNVVAIVDPPRMGLHPVVIKALRTHPHLRRLVYISCNPESLVANAIELCTPTSDKTEKGKNNRAWRNMSSAGLARHRTKSMPNSEPFRPVKAMAVDLFPHTPHCEMVMLLER
ncbi:hypothetical protein GIB67_027667 [Kingdonia uniflora]|uniref:Uncharacterized protein n=1 Tax=Kingdonia uniflora TaxID=39325 RepID=A0A7J7NKW9_9MAGN|nr:hypothetical protein GIB67_027667 [Kingdonia uniflora]